MPRIVMKFGGTSVANLDRIREVALRVKRETEAGNQVAVVVSAMAGATNQLVEWCQALAPLHDDLPLADSGLDSLCFAILVARLEDATGVDPFASTDGTPVPVMLRDWIALYDRFAA